MWDDIGIKREIKFDKGFKMVNPERLSSRKEPFFFSHHKKKTSFLQEVSLEFKMEFVISTSPRVLCKMLIPVLDDDDAVQCPTGSNDDDTGVNNLVTNNWVTSGTIGRIVVGVYITKIHPPGIRCEKNVIVIVRMIYLPLVVMKLTY